MSDELIKMPLNAEGKQWNGPSMDIMSGYETVVVFHGACKAQTTWGSGKTDPNPILELGHKYVLEDVDIHGSYTNVKIRGFSAWFTSEAFHNLVDNKPEYWEIP